VAASAASARALRTTPATGQAIDDAFRDRVHENLVAMMERRVPGWTARFAPPR
jgi:hypothetical protein